MLSRLCLGLLIIAALLGAQTKKVVVIGVSPNDVRELQAVSPVLKIVAPSSIRASDYTTVTPDSPEAQDRELLREVSDADAIIGGPTRAVIQAAKRLKWVQILSAGVEAYRYPELIESDIVMTNGRGIASPGIADHAFGMLLAFTRKLNSFIETRSQENWDRRARGLLELNGKTAVIIGVGNIGSQVAQRAHGFDMTVIGVDPKEMNPSQIVQRMVIPLHLDTVLPLADVVFMCAPETPESTGMMGVKQFGLMKKGSYFIAVSRGPLYNMDALVKALQSGHLAGAGVDVTDPEPLPKGHPLWKCPNVIITPHVATQTDMERTRRMELIKYNLERFAKGEPLKNVVDKVKGY